VVDLHAVFPLQRGYQTTDSICHRQIPKQKAYFEHLFCVCLKANLKPQTTVLTILKFENFKNKFINVKK